MQLSLETGSGANLIRGYSDTEIRIGDRSIRRSCIVTADTLTTDWAPQSYADLRPEHLAVILAQQPEVVVIGTGAVSQFAPAAVRALLAQQRVGLEVMELGAACRTYNVLVQDQRRVAAALFLR
ncbi:MAG: MTH938/NDUFAF3 family protein [Steroidobacteraceae bacterium]